MTVVLYDAMNIFFKGYYTSSHVGLYSGVGSALTYLLGYGEDLNADEFILCGESTTPLIRKQMYPEYKMNRKSADEDIVRERKKFIEVMPKLGIPYVYRNGYEGDDVIGTLSRRYYDKGWNVIIISGDRDLLQLINDKVFQLQLKSKEFPVLMTEDTFEEQYGFPVSCFVEYKALCGDSSDNIPGCRGIGAKTAINIIKKYGTINTFLNHYTAEEYKHVRMIQENQTLVDLSRVLSKVDCNIPDLDIQPKGEPHTTFETVEQTLRELESFDAYETYFNSKMYTNHIYLNHM
jgi:DNA polymerase-1